MGIQFYETVRGKIFFEHQLPELIKALNRCADELEKARLLKEEKENKEEQKD